MRRGWEGTTQTLQYFAAALQGIESYGSQVIDLIHTSLVELKLDATITFKWQRHSQDKNDVPRYQDSMDFIDLRA